MSNPSYDPHDQRPAADPAAQGYGPGYGAAASEPVPGRAVMRPDQQRLWATLAHLSPIAAGLLTVATSGFLWTGVLGPLIIFLVLKDRGGFVRAQALEALNFQIIPTIVYVVGFLFGVITFTFGFIITIPIMVAVGIVVLVFQIIAAVRANQGVEYRYPLSWRLVK